MSAFLSLKLKSFIVFIACILRHKDTLKSLEFPHQFQPLQILPKSLALCMDFSEIIGHEHIKSHLKTTLQNGRVAHAQLFSGLSGSGLLPLALAYAKEILCDKHEKGSDAYIRCSNNVANLTHPDLHFAFPVNTNDTVKKNPVSSSFSEEWRSFVNENPYGSLFNWFQLLGIENKQGNISVRSPRLLSH